MMLATEPVMVKLPASVLAIASISHPVCELAKPGTTDFSSITAGTLLTTFDRAATARVKTAGLWRFHARANSRSQSPRPAFSAPPTMMNSPTK
ncbi:MAG: hypothetical protein M1423_11195, partial [Acidobacteria bacterium]|nr:hypothetical protein [Acidobacteriota bacterium]